MRVCVFVLLIISVVNAANIKDFLKHNVGGKALPALNYHDNIGIPQARRIKEAEDELMKGSRIVGGDKTSINKHPYLAGLIISILNSSNESVCGASLISRNRLVTAAHCWNDGSKQAWLFEVVLGSQFLYHGGTRFPSTTVTPHPDFRPDILENDVAIVELYNDVTFTELIQPISLPSETQLTQTFTGFWATASGFGRIQDDLRISPDSQVSQVALNIIPLVSCRAVYSSQYVQASNLCTSGEGGVGICFGDSGGPLTTQYKGTDVLIGVSSFVAEAGCSKGFPSAFSRVTSFQSFITQHL